MFERNAAQLLVFKVNPANCVGFKLHLTYMEAVGCVLIPGAVSSDPTTNTIYTMSIWLALHQITSLVSKGKKCNLIWIKCCGEMLRLQKGEEITKQAAGDEM